MLAETRRKQIIDLLRQRENGAVSIIELSDELRVSEMTIRRDLDFLERKDLLRRVHAGAVAFTLEEPGTPFHERTSEADFQKKVIAQLAARLVNEGETIILDAGTTTREVARNLVGRHKLTIITNNILIAEEMAQCPKINTILLGGILKHIEVCTVGSMVKQSLSYLTADKFFLSAAGISLKRGLTDPDMAEVEIKQAMMRAADEVILVADSTKVDITSLVRIAPIREINKWVTDDNASPEIVAAVESEGVEVITPFRMQSGFYKNLDGYEKKTV
ncbi:MAG: DeoR/GlpR transcriptional regulator [Planctomycetes bacterium]|nr:DeoR/GlpR transcriptional regulator [Planctomycetota bacterium]